MKKIFNILVIGLIIVSFSSCLKDEVIIGPDAPGAIRNVIEFQNIGPISSPPTAPSPMYIPFTAEKTDVTREIEAIVNYAGVDVAPQDIVVTLAADPAIITNYNSKVAGSNFTQLPSAQYTMPTSVTIPKGQRTVKFKIVVKPIDFDATFENALAIKIVSASIGTISGNFGTNILSFPLKSIWQGTYTQTVENNFGTLNSSIGVAPYTETGIKLATVGPNRVQSANVALTYGGSTTYQFNGNNTGVTSVAVFSGSAIPTTFVATDAIDATARTFKIRYITNGWGITETWVRTGD